MKNQLANLQNNESILLMYLAGELPAEDREEVETLLHNDQSLQKLLAELQSTHDFVTAQFRAADQATPLVGQFSAARQVGAVIRQNHADALRALANAPAEMPHRPMSWWITGPLVGAACIALGMFLWWHYGTDDTEAGPLAQVLTAEERALEYCWSNRLNSTIVNVLPTEDGAFQLATTDSSMVGDKSLDSDIASNPVDSLLGSSENEIN